MSGQIVQNKLFSLAEQKGLQMISTPCMKLHIYPRSQFFPTLEVFSTYIRNCIFIQGHNYSPSSRFDQRNIWIQLLYFYVEDYKEWL